MLNLERVNYDLGVLDKTLTAVLSRMIDFETMIAELQKDLEQLHQEVRGQ